ncbi:MAG: SDR family oxidoreductase [Saprospiraceae bacterium]|nr:SDR family oxidoreductase [Saprospiraceae bacterium]
MFSDNLFQGQIVLITGGRSGIGYTMAESFLKCGAIVYIASRKEEKLLEAQSRLSEFGEVHAKACDIRNTEDIDALVEFIKSNSHDLDILVNNAGGQFLSTAEHISDKGWQAVVNNNLNGTWYMTQRMAKAFFIPKEKGVIVNIIINIYKGFPGMAHSAAARAGVDSLTKTLAIEWSKYNIRINAIAPGSIQSSGLQNYPPDFVSKLADLVPLKKLGTTKDVADLSLFLSSPNAGFITGETIYLDGGQRLTGGLYELFNQEP